MTGAQLKDKRVLIMGLGRFGGGVGAARYCARMGARVLVTDLLPADQLTESVAKLAGTGVEFRLGEHRVSDFTEADLIVVNPAVDQRNNQYLHAAEKAGVPRTTEIGLLIGRLNREQIIGVTGTAGKSTTVAMIGHILDSYYGARKVHVGGNIGGSLLSEVEAILADDHIVLELSSFMLEMLPGFSPHIAVVTNIGDNHLDRHETLDAYVKAKKTLLRHQTKRDFVVLGPNVADWRYDSPAVSIIVDNPLDVELLVPGAHNQLNAAVAVAACECAHVPREKAIEAVRTFRGLTHRLQLVAEHAGVRYYNDSKSTTPAAAMLAIDAFPEKTVHLILGGYDKHADLTEMSQYAAGKCAAVYTIGHTGPTIGDLAEKVDPRCAIHRCALLDIAVREAVQHVRPGDVVVLSPGCASWDQFENYEKRGSAFAEAVLRYTHQE